MKLTKQELTELQKRIEDHKNTPNVSQGTLNLKYEAKKNIDNFTKELAIKYGYDYTRHAINNKTGEIIPL